MSKADVFSLDGRSLKKIDLPEQFSEELRIDLIRRAFNAIRSHEVQPQGVTPRAGMRHSVFLRKRRHVFKSVYGYGRSRTPRKTMSRRGTRFSVVGTEAPFTIGGRRVRAPVSAKVIIEKINVKERKKAIRSAISACKNLVIEDKLEGLSNTKKLVDTLSKNKVKVESVKRRYAGKAKMRGRTTRYKIGPLIITSGKSALIKAGSNLPGVEVISVKDLNVKALAPGSKPGRLAVWSEAAVNKLRSEKLFK